MPFLDFPRFVFCMSRAFTVAFRLPSSPFSRPTWPGMQYIPYTAVTVGNLHGGPSMSRERAAEDGRPTWPSILNGIRWVVYTEVRPEDSGSISSPKFSINIIPKNIGPRWNWGIARSILFFLPFYISILTNGGRRGEMGQRCVSGFCMCSVYAHTYGEVVNGLANCTAEGGGGKQGKRISTSDYG